ncbi:hypothetical protein [Paraburkholderia sediminicola]|uniref:hypothetical protein n=1 Tax=Paraburkholderia sediminicola TaxID=458836 RepID=UPI0038B94EF1
MMAGIRFAGKDYPPTSLAMLHGFLAASAVTMLIHAAATVGLPSLAMYVTVLFVVAAGGGVLMNLGYHWKKRSLPRALVVVHALPAAVGLVVATFSTRG